MGAGLNKPLFAQRCLQKFFFFSISRSALALARSLRSSAHLARALAYVF